MLGGSLLWQNSKRRIFNEIDGPLKLQDISMQQAGINSE